jgi:HD-like signal output (HDOD) protein/CheY-like chemotaxis protein
MKTLLFVDDEPRVLQGLERQLRGLRDEWDMHFAQSGAKALEFMAMQPVDVIISDMLMPGMDGAQLLSEVVKRHPQTTRIVLSGHADRESVLRLVGPAHQYLSKPCDAEELRAAISRAAALSALLSNDRLKRLTAEIKTLPSLPMLHQRLTSEFRKDEPSLERVGEIVSQDIGMTTKILQLVNSAFFGLSQSISNPTEAVAYLGLTTIRSMVLSLQVFSQFDQRKIKGFSIEALAQHGWRTGIFARRIAQIEHSELKVGDQCFLAGLLHDVGRLILASNLPEGYERAWQVAQEPGKSLLETESAEFGATHAEVGAYLLGLWGLPNPVVEAVAFHHRPNDCPHSGFAPVIAVHVANRLAHEKDGDYASEGANAVALANAPLASRVVDWKRGCLHEELP